MPETPLTVPSLVDEVLDSIHGYSRHQEQRTSLTTGVGPDDLTLTVDDINQVSKGVLEIEDEIVQVATVDVGGNVVTLEPWGRGQSGTTAVAHGADVRVTSAPLFPRQRVRNAIFGVLREIFPLVYATSSTLLDGSAVVTNFVLPADCYHVLSVENRLVGPSGQWIPVKRWRQNKQPTTVELEVLSPVAVGTGRVRVNYVRVPPPTFGDLDDLASYGYDYQVRDLIVLGATAKLVSYLEPARVQTESMVAAGRADSVPAGAAANASKLLYSLYQKRVEDERQQLLSRYPIQPHFLR
jgi:hypothetical protein